MPIKLSCSSIVTINVIKEFLLCKTSLENYHNVEWFICCDDESAKIMQNFDNINIVKIIDLNFSPKEFLGEKGRDHKKWHALMLYKLDAVYASIDKNNYSIFLDSDMVFTNALEDKFISLLNNTYIDGMFSPHMCNDIDIEKEVGYYNGGFFVIKNIELAHRWAYLSKSALNYNLYYEQQPLQFASYDFFIVSIPSNYNISKWRFSQYSYKKPSKIIDILEDMKPDSICLKNDQIFYNNMPAVCFHTHYRDKLHYDFIAKKLIYLFKQSNNKNYKKNLNII